MRELLLLTCIPILYFYPVLYPPLACFTANFFIDNKKINYLSVSVFLVFSAAVISSLIGATIIPRSDTLVYVESFKNSSSFEISSDVQFEPLYQVYEHFLNILTGNNEKLFLLLTALIFNILSVIGISRICMNLNQPNISYIIISIYFSLVQPSMGLPLFLLRSSLSLSIMLVAISFYKHKQIIFYALGIISIFIHYGSIPIFSLLIFHNFWLQFSQDDISLSSKLISRLKQLSLIICLLCFLLTVFYPDLITSRLLNLIVIFGQSGVLASNKAEWFVGKKNDLFINIFNPIFFLQIGSGLLCSLKLNKDLSLEANERKYLASIRFIGIFQIITIMTTLPLSLLPVRLGLFHFLYFPLWLVNIPFLPISNNYKKYRKYLILSAAIFVIYFTFYSVPIRQFQDYRDSKINADIVVLEGKPLNYKLIQLIEYYL
ncbi:MAG: EpsG family protein [Dolichospermum sp.]